MKMSKHTAQASSIIIKVIYMYPLQTSFNILHKLKINGSFLDETLQIQCPKFMKQNELAQ